MRVTTRKSIEQQAQLPEESTSELKKNPGKFKSLTIMAVLFVVSMSSFRSEADIYRFVTTDGVETFTDAPSNKSATVVIKDRPITRIKHQKSTKKQKTHDISLDEIIQKAVASSLNPQDGDQNIFDAHLPSVGGTITSKVGMRIDPFDGRWRQHNGIDIAVPNGTPVRPVAGGIVVYSGYRSGYGKTIIVEHNNGVITLYGHNSTLLISEGHPVTIDSTIALSGSTGRSTGPHLHFEAWQAGINVTMAFLPNSGIKLPKTTLIASSQRTPRFRSETLADGSILFTNIPYSTP